MNNQILAHPTLSLAGKKYNERNFWRFIWDDSECLVHARAVFFDNRNSKPPFKDDRKNVSHANIIIISSSSAQAIFSNFTSESFWRQQQWAPSSLPLWRNPRRWRSQMLPASEETQNRNNCPNLILLNDRFNCACAKWDERNFSFSWKNGKLFYETSSDLRTQFQEN